MWGGWSSVTQRGKMVSVQSKYNLKRAFHCAVKNITAKRLFFCLFLFSSLKISSLIFTWELKHQTIDLPDLWAGATPTGKKSHLWMLPQNEFYNDKRVLNHSLFFLHHIFFYIFLKIPPGLVRLFSPRSGKLNMLHVFTGNKNVTKKIDKTS